MSASTAEVPDDLLCPICFEIPLDKVFQCEEGHTLCETCYGKLTECPQCKVKLGKQKTIRNRIAERMLESYRCPYQAFGCTKLVDPRTRDEHQENCIYNESKYGTLLNICETFGIEKCSFRMNKQNVAVAFQHLQSEHNVVLRESEYLVDLPKLIFNARESKLIYSTQSFILVGKEESYSVIIKMSLINEHDGTCSLSFTPNTFPYSNESTTKQYVIDFSILRSKNPEVETDELGGSIIPSNETADLNRRFSLLFKESNIPKKLIAIIRLRVLGNQMTGDGSNLLVAVDAKGPINQSILHELKYEQIKSEMETLQERIKVLELEKRSAEDKLKNFQQKPTRDSEADEDMAFLEGRTYELIWGRSQHKEYKNFLMKLGHGYIQSRVASHWTEQISWEKENGRWLQSITSRLGNDTQLRFIFGEKFHEEMPDRRACKSVIALAGNRLIHRMKIGDLQQATISREFKDDENLMIATFRCEDVQATRIYKRIF